MKNFEFKKKKIYQCDGDDMVGVTFSRVCAQLSHIARNERIYTTAHNCGWLFWKKNVHNLGVCLVYSMDPHLIFGDYVQLSRLFYG